MKTVVFMIVVIAGGLVFSLRMNSNPPVAVENYNRYKCNGQDPIQAVMEHFKQPVHQVLVREYKPSGTDKEGIIISGYVVWDIELTRAHYSCKDGVKTLKSF